MAPMPHSDWQDWRDIELGPVFVFPAWKNCIQCSAHPRLEQDTGNVIPGSC